MSDPADVIRIALNSLRAARVVYVGLAPEIAAAEWDEQHAALAALLEAAQQKEKEAEAGSGRAASSAGEPNVFDVSIEPWSEAELAATPTIGAGARRAITEYGPALEWLAEGQTVSGGETIVVPVEPGQLDRPGEDSASRVSEPARDGDGRLSGGFPDGEVDAEDCQCDVCRRDRAEAALSVATSRAERAERERDTLREALAGPELARLFKQAESIGGDIEGRGNDEYFEVRTSEFWTLRQAAAAARAVLAVSVEPTKKDDSGGGTAARAQEGSHGDV